MLGNTLVSMVLAGWQTKNAKMSRNDNHIHATNFLRFCPREFALCQTTGVLYNQERQKVFDAEIITRELGIAIEHSVKDSLKEIGKLVHHNLRLSMNYGEYLITGGIDLVVNMSEREGRLALFPVEVKSIGKEEFYSMERPLMSHECQLSVYLWMLKKLKIPDINSEHGIVLYVPKLQISPKHRPLRAFTIEPQRKFLRNVESKLKELKTFSKTKELPQRICPSRHAMMAEECKVVAPCFQDQ